MNGNGESTEEEHMIGTGTGESEIEAEVKLMKRHGDCFHKLEGAQTVHISTK